MEKTLRDNIVEQATIFAAFADPTRLKLIRLLCNQTPPGCRCVNALSLLLGITQSATSQHLRVLRSVGLVRGERRGYRIHYLINQEALRRCQSILSSALEMPETCKEELCTDHCSTSEGR